MSPKHPLFPVKLSCIWQDSSNFQLSEHLLDWLLESGSLTAKLKNHCQQFAVEVLGQQIQTCQADEANNYIAQGEQVLVREVLLYCDQVPQVFARSLIPLTSLTGEEQQLAHLGSKPLGQALFNNPTLERKDIKVACFEQSSSVGQLVKQLHLNTEQIMWGRRSTFLVHKKPLLVAEVFLPGAFAYHLAKFKAVL